MPQCVLCSHHRGSRVCPALNAGICPRCCGTKRRRGVNCPKDCSYLQTARARAAARAPEFADLERVREMDPEFVSALEDAIITVQEERFRDLKDREVKEALRNLYKTLETEERGLLYEYRSPDPRIQILADAVGRVVKQYREGEDVTYKVEIIEVKACLLAAINVAKMTTRRSTDSVEYLDYIARYARPPQPDRQDQPVSRIILP